MEWTKIDKTKTEYPRNVSSYSEYKQYLRHEADKKCVYCAINEAVFGGADSYHVEHFRPKSLEKFRHLEREYSNLFYACAVCNRFKSNDWHEGYQDDHSSVGYPDPNKVDYNTLFETDNDFLIVGKFTASKYLVEKLYLNRPQLVLARKLEGILKEFHSLTSETKPIIADLGKCQSDQARECLTKICEKLWDISCKFAIEIEQSKYEISDLRRPL